LSTIQRSQTASDRKRPLGRSLPVHAAEDKRRDSALKSAEIFKQVEHSRPLPMRQKMSSPLPVGPPHRPKILATLKFFLFSSIEQVRKMDDLSWLAEARQRRLAAERSQGERTW
jgi:hypothetical protein